MSKFLVIADDFTGSNDTGVQFAKKGAKVAINLSEQRIACDVSVINTESRALLKEQSKQKIIEAIQQNRTEELNIIFKKIDSTFRGNIGAEIDAIYESFVTPLIIVAAAIPSAKRTTIDGQCLVNGIPLLETEFAQDPKTPINSSRIANIIKQQSVLNTEEIGLERIRKGDLLSIFEQQLMSKTPKVFILDSESDEDLALINNALSQLKKPFILVGAAGIANQLSKEMYCNNVKPVFILSGSMSVTTQEQIDYCAQKGLKIIELDAQSIWFEPDKLLESTINNALFYLLKGENCAIRTVKDQDERKRSQQFCQQKNINGTEMGNKIAQFLGAIAKQVIEQIPLSGALFTGGDIAIAAAQALGADGYIIKGEVEPCIPYGHFTGDSTNIVTKAGGFGSVYSIENTIQFLQGNL